MRLLTLCCGLRKVAVDVLVGEFYRCLREENSAGGRGGGGQARRRRWKKWHEIGAATKVK